MFGSIGIWEIMMIFLVVLLLFGPNKLPEVAKTLGKTIRDFRRTINDAKLTIENEIEKSDLKKEINPFSELQSLEQTLKKEIKGDDETKIG